MGRMIPASVMRQQPAQDIPVDLENSIARKLTALFGFNGSFRSALLRSGNPVVTAGPTIAAGANGFYALGNGAGKVVTDLLPSVLGMTGATPRSFVVEFYMPDSNADKCLFSFGDTSSSTRSQVTLIANNDYRTVQLQLYGNDTSYAVHSVGGTGARVFLAITYDGGTKLTFRSWARLDSTGQVIYNTQTTTLAGALNTGNTVPLNLMGGGTYGFPSLNVPLYYLAMFGGWALLEGEIRSLYENQWQLYAPPQGPATARMATLAASAPAPGALLSSIGTSRASAAAMLSTSIPLSAHASARAASAASLATAITLSSIATSPTTAAASFASTGTTLAATATTPAMTGAALATGIRLATPASTQARAGAALATSMPLAAMASTQAHAAAALSTAISLAGAAKTFAMAMAALSTAAPPAIDISKLSLSRIVTFDGSGSRVVTFEATGNRIRINNMSAKVPAKIGSKWTVDRDPDEESYYAADITDELTDRNTTIASDADAIEPILQGVTQLEDLSVQTLTVGGIQRTYIVVLLGGVDGALPTEWFWTARVRCANGERFDKTTWFNRVDT